MRQLLPAKAKVDCPPFVRQLACRQAGGYLTLITLLTTITLSGCGFGAQPALVSDFTPPTALATNPEPEKEGPQDRMLKLATSEDGLSFESAKTILSYQAHEPDAIVDTQGRILVYYTGWILGDRLNRSAVAISQDAGDTWTFKYLQITGSDEYWKPVDIDAVVLPDGRVRIYYTSGNPGIGRGIHYAQSNDGVNFEYGGAAFALSDYTAFNPTVFQVDGVWHLYAMSDDETYPVWHTTSADGITFEVYARTSFPIDNNNAQPSNGLWLGDRFHLFVTTQAGEIRSFSTADGTNWAPDESTRLVATRRERLVEDPAVIGLSPGRFLMVYSTTEPF